MLKKSMTGFIVLVFMFLIGFSALEGQQSPATASSGDYIYWANFWGHSVGRASLDLSDVKPGFISMPDRWPTGIAVDDRYIYWANFNWNAPSTIGRANLDGTDVNQEFIQTLGSPIGLAVDDNYIYWANIEGVNTIGRAKLDGTDINQQFITLVVGMPRGMAVSRDFIYWANYNTGTIGRANLNGTGVNENWITGCGGQPHGVTVTEAYIYWANYGDGTIRRANLDGTGAVILQSGYPAVIGVGTKGDFIYWGQFGGPSLGRSDLNFSAPDPNWIAGIESIYMIALTPDFINVAIDIKPGGYPNTINLTSNGVVPVAILSSATFDATTVDPITVTLAGAGVRLKGNGTPIASFQDVNKDGLLDIVVQVETSALVLTDTDVNATLQGKTKTGQRFKGQDTIRVIK